jgi:hypothetical protein
MGANKQRLLRGDCFHYYLLVLVSILYFFVDEVTHRFVLLLYFAKV